MADLSWVVAGMGAVVGGVAAEVSNQRRVARRLGSRSAARWEALGGLERYRIGRELRRGRTLDPGDAELGAEVAEALRAELSRRRWTLWFAGGLALLFVLLTVVTLAAGKIALAGVEAGLTVILILTAVWPPHIRRRLAVAEEANRAIYERGEFS